MTDKTTSYMTRLLPNCMLTYQFIEEGLRGCLIRYHAITKMKIGGEIHYKIPFESIENAAMGRLIQFFIQFNDDTDLIKRLREAKEQRDSIAHQGYLLTYEEQNDAVFISEKFDETERSLQKAKACMELVHKEMQRLEDLANKIAAERAS